MINKTHLLEQIDGLDELKRLGVEQLQTLSEEIRSFILKEVSKNGGHLGASLGAIEIAVAIHYCFDSPKDKIIWDVGHQCYAHKILTGRKSVFNTLRHYCGISGFPKCTESIHDAYGTGHASTSISAGLGMAKARDLRGMDFHVVAVIGDGAFTGGNALEAINQAGYLNTKIIIVLNDNRMSISKNVGAFSQYTHRIEQTETYKQVREAIAELINKGNGLRDELVKLKSYIKAVGAPGLLFEKLGFNYIGPVDGHNIPEMCESFKKAKTLNGPVLIHLRTVKGKGYGLAEQNQPRFHGVNPFNIDNGEDLKCSDGKTFTQIFAETMLKIGKENPSVVAVTAAMPDGTGLTKFRDAFPERFFDVGIAEQHAVVFSAGMAKEGLIPVCAIYSTFLQRAYDAIVHDVCLQELPVIFAVDRAGLVGRDGPTHHGAFDLAYLRHIPNLVVMAPKDGRELRDMMFTATKIRKPVAIRFPRGGCFKVTDDEFRMIDIGKCEMVQKGDDVCLVCIGAIFGEGEKAWEVLKGNGIKASLINARFAKPIDREIAAEISRIGRCVVIEEGTMAGGFGSAVVELCEEMSIKADTKRLGLPDRFIEHGGQDRLRVICGLNSKRIAEEAEKLVNRGMGRC